MSSSVKTAVQVSTLVLVVVASVVIFFVPTDAKASCFYPKRTHTKYYGWEWDYAWRCDAPIIGPAMPATLIGERTVECDGTVTQWGQACVGGTNQTMTISNCTPICD
jgi:hypothetical protein